MTIDIRPTRPDEYRAAAATISTALLFPPPDDAAFERSLPSWQDTPSTFTAWDGERCVGHASQFLFDTTVPGGARLPTGGVTRVGVLATHRRRGAATGLLRALVADAAERGLALMSLRASEAVIYQRFGFGVAGEFTEMKLSAARARPISGAATGGSFRLLAPGELLDVVPPLYERVAHRRPGIVTRPASWWRRYLREAIEESKASVVGVHTGPDGDDGYVHYTVGWNEAPGESGGKGSVHDLFGASDAVELALWQYLLDIDLVHEWTADERPVDDLVRLACRDRRAYQITSIDDEQWLRLVDVDVALATRTYAPVDGSVTIGVHDPLLDRNDGTWRISAAGAERLDAGSPVDTSEVDISTTIGPLSAAYLGGTPWWTLAGTGAVTAADPSAIALADALFASRPLPWCGSHF